MSLVRGKWFNRVAVGLGVFLVLAGGLMLLRLSAERNALNKEVSDLNIKVAQLKNKYSEQKAMAESMLRARQIAESGSREAESLKQENEKLQALVEAEKRKGAKAVAKQEEQLGEMKNRFARLRSDFDKFSKESKQTLLEKGKKIAELTGERDALKVSLKQETAQHKLCVKNNARLAKISTELVKKYKNKGVLGALATSEPFTQIEKVELEKLCQEYLDKIDKDTL